jgi:hypothetical protein
MAVNLARSFWLWNAQKGINLYVVTDQQELIPADVMVYVNVIQLKAGELGEGFSPKLHLDKIAPEGQTLFIDSDCLVYGNLVEVFEKFNGHHVAVTGTYISGGEWFGDIKSICAKMGIFRLPKFNGGVYYLEKSEKATAVYQKARDLEPHYDEIGFVRLRGRPNDEVLLALAMELNHEKPITDDGSILAEFVNFQSGIKSNLLKGEVTLYNNPAHPQYNSGWPLTSAKPLIVHFLGHHNQLMPYVKEAKQLEYLFGNKFSPNSTKLLTFLKVILPFEFKNSIKNTFRSFYRRIFGVREVKKSERIVD